HMEQQQIVDRRARQPDRLRERVGRLHREPHAVERGVERYVARGDRARHGVDDLLPEAEILEEIARGRFWHVAQIPADGFMPACSARSMTRWTSRTVATSTIAPSTWIAPRPCACASR